MALQSSGAISISDIKSELSSSSNSLRDLSAAAGKSSPDAMSEFYGFSSYTPPSYSSGASSVSGAGTQASPYVITVTSFNSGLSEELAYACDEIFAGQEIYNIYRVVSKSINFTNNTNVPQKVNVTINTLTGSWSTAFECDYWGYMGVAWNGYMNPNNVSVDAGTDMNAVRTGGQNILSTIGDNTVGRTYRLSLFGQVWYQEQGRDCYNGTVYYTDTVCSHNPSFSNWTVTVWFAPV